MENSDDWRLSAYEMQLAMWLPCPTSHFYNQFAWHPLTLNDLCVLPTYKHLSSLLFSSCVHFLPLVHISTGLSLVALLDVEE